ncbi:MAG: tetratricopeptide repeat protein [Bacteroidales bacterium]|nr:tetratricopeptide repeat protein [Bacteroidales bacterium]
MKNIKILTISVLLLFFGISAMAQKTAAFQSPDALYKSAYELFQKQKYGVAQEQFTEVTEMIDAPSSLLRSNAEYYAALCALELFNEDAEEKLTRFIEDHPEHSKVRTAHFQLGKYQYRKNRYRHAIRSFQLVDVYDLNSEERDEYNFKLAYSYFMSDNNDEATNYFYKLIKKDNKYHDPANYYYGHIAYEKGNYETALESFNKLLDNKIFKPILPYYITQIYYQQKKFDKLLEVAPGLLKDATEKRKAEIARLIGDAYYKTDRFDESVPYLEKYHELTRRSLTREDHYQLAYTYYRIKKYEKAISHFDKVTTMEDTMTQNAYYHMADCYLKTDQKKFAYNSFLSAYKTDENEEITKDALFNYAKLAYELSYDPYNEAIRSFQKFIDEYPESDRLDEANSYLVKLFLSTKNYKSAFEALESIDQKTTNLKIAYQQIAYYRGVELFNNQRIDAAISMFEKSRKHNYSKALYAKAIYWTAEGQFRKGKFQDAISNYKNFQLTAGAFRLDFYNESNYNIGYAYFKLSQHENALVYFRKFLNNKDESDEQKMINDAMLRKADCYYAEGLYSEAIDTYDQVAGLNMSDKDYALYQKAIAEGVIGKYELKTKTLTKLVEEMPNSAYADDAAYELANTYLILDNNQKALRYFNTVINNYPNSSHLVKSMQKKGLTYYNTDNYDLALNTFKNIRKQYPGTKESKEALVSIRNIYTNINQLEKFFKYAKENAITLTDSDRDSTLFTAASNLYMDGDCEKATTSLKKYLRQFPKGIFALNAHYYLADCYYRNGNMDQAGSHYKLIADTSVTNYTEKSVLRLAKIYYENENYPEALTYYKKLERISDFKNNKLEARKWIMRCQFKLKNYKQALIASRKLIQTDKASDDWINEAYMTIGKSSLKLDSTSTALKAFQYLTEELQNEMAVEAKYLMAETEYEQGNIKKSEDLLFEIINQVPSYDYWIAKSFILIADLYTQKGNIVQAKATLRSIIDNYKLDPASERPNLVEIAQNKLDEIIAKEESESKPDQRAKDMELDYSGEEESGIFDEEILPDSTQQNNTDDSQ